jgi:uncharacterized protein YdbL (DUF1318 family)
MSTGRVSERNKSKMAKVTSIRKDIAGQVAKIRAALKDRMYSRVAESTGLHVNTVRKLAKEQSSNFSLTTIEKLERYLFGVQK